MLGLLLPPEVIVPVHYWTMFALCSMTALHLINRAEDRVLTLSKVDLPMALVLSLFAGFICIQIIERGMISQALESDVKSYVNAYLTSGSMLVPIDWNEEWGWTWLMNVSNKLGLSVSAFFVLVQTLYTGCMLFVCRSLMKGKEWISMLFFIDAFLFIGGGSNGIRSGLALSLVLLAIALLERATLWKVVAMLLLTSAVSIHRSAWLPVVAVLFSWTTKLKPRYAMAFWLSSIIISLVAGDAVENFFIGLGFDDRLESYIKGQDDDIMQRFSYMGFRWDFLLYSAMPILFVWYLTVKRNFQDKMYNLIANTYILSNAFWVMVIRASFSNRFASLSWFLYPLLFAYPLLRFKIWEDQDRKVGLILLAYASFTFLMYLRG